MTGDLLNRLVSMRIEEPGAARTFEEALADEQGWSRGRAEAVAAEYRRFLYLAATSGRDVTPSAIVDKAWHLHLTYSRHYWDTLCGTMLGQPLHHRPSPGGAIESERYRRQYEDSLALYEATFGTPPPPSIWPRRGAAAHGGPAAAPKGLERVVWPALGTLAAAGAGAMAGPLAFLAAALLVFIVWLIVRTLRSAQQDGRKDAAGGACGGGGTDSAAWTGDCADGAAAGCGGGCGGD